MDNPEGRRNEPRKLDTIPYELVFQIAEKLTLGIHEGYPGESDTASHLKRGVDARRNLGNLCLVSRKIYSAVQRALYRDVIIRKPRNLVYLYRSMLENPKLGDLIKRVSFDVYCPGWIDLTPLHGYKENGFDEYWTERSLSVRVQALGIRPTSAMLLAKLLLTLYIKVLSCTPSLVSLDLVIPAEYSPSSEALGDFLPSVSVDRTSRSMWDGVSLPRLPRLETLRLMGSGITRYPSMLVERLCEAFLAGPQARRMIWSGDDETWFKVMSKHLGHDAAPGHECGIVKVIELRESSCIPLDFLNICGSFPHLESLLVDNEPSRAGNRIFKDLSLLDTGGRFISEKLSCLRHLQNLTLNLYCHCNISAALGASGTLTLVSLPELHSLTVPMSFFVEMQPGGEYRGLCPDAVLPRSLRSLTLATDIYGTEKWCDLDFNGGLHQSRAIVLGFLYALSDICRTSFPNLREVAYIQGSAKIEDNWAGCPCRADPPRPEECPLHFEPPVVGHDGSLAPFEEVLRSFGRAGVLFNRTKIGPEKAKRLS